MSRWDLRHPFMVKLCWAACVLGIILILVGMIAANNQPSYDAPYQTPAAKTFYGPLECWPDAQMLVCQRPYVPHTNPVK